MVGLIDISFSETKLKEKCWTKNSVSIFWYILICCLSPRLHNSAWNLSYSCVLCVVVPKDVCMGPLSQRACSVKFIDFYGDITPTTLVSIEDTCTWWYLCHFVSRTWDYSDLSYFSFSADLKLLMLLCRPSLLSTATETSWVPQMWRMPVSQPWNLWLVLIISIYYIFY